MGIKASARRLVTSIRFRLETVGWDALRSVGNSRLVKSSYAWLFVVPVAARILEPIAAKYTVPAWLDASTPEVSLSLPFNWVLFYFMALCFAVGQAVYALSCPGIVKRFANFGEFRSAHTGGGWLTTRLIETMAKQTPQERQSTTRSIMVFLDFEHDEIAALKEFEDPTAKGSERDGMGKLAAMLLRCVRARRESEVSLGELFDIVYPCACRERPVLRWFAAACFFVGFVLLVVVVGQNTHAVLRMW